jgi:hypothetical protein
MPAEGLEPPTNGLQSSDREFQGLMYQPLAALASPIPKPTTAQLRHTQSELDTFPAQGASKAPPLGPRDTLQSIQLSIVHRPGGSHPER